MEIVLAIASNFSDWDAGTNERESTNSTMERALVRTKDTVYRSCVDRCTSTSLMFVVEKNFQVAEIRASNPFTGSPTP